MRLLTTIATVLAQFHQYRVILDELEAYTDRELNDLGIGRGDLPRVAWEEAERRFPSPDHTTDAGFPKVAARSIELAVAGQR
jgi:uncharacterized protein YjiS (DUF1127 family)